MKRKGITLLEVVVALSLSALMLVALNGVLSGLNRQKKRSTLTYYREWGYELDRIFWNDLAQARGVSLDQGVLTMEIPAGAQIMQNESRDGNSTGTLQAVVYQLIPSAKDKNRLSRSVYGVSGTTSRPLITQTLLWDVRQATFERVDDSGNSQPLPRTIGPAPRAFRYQLWIGNEPEPRSSQILVR